MAPPRWPSSRSVSTVDSVQGAPTEAAEQTAPPPRAPAPPSKPRVRSAPVMRGRRLGEPAPIDEHATSTGAGKVRPASARSARPAAAQNEVKPEVGTAAVGRRGQPLSAR
eukprot:6660410-Prymnesium_polylepis.2